MESTVETLSPTRVRFAIEVPFAELEQSLRKAYKDIGAQVSIPGFRKGKIPSAILDQRVGRERILSEAVADVIPKQVVAAIRQHNTQTLGRPEVEITGFSDGQPLTFTAEVDVRPEITLPDLASIEVSVDEVVVTEADIDEQVEGLKLRFATLRTVTRPAQRGDFVQIDLTATVDGAEVPGGSATNLSHEVGSDRLLPGLDDVLVGMAAEASATFSTALVAGEFEGREAQVGVTVRAVKERELPTLDDDFASLASEFDTVSELRGDLAERLRRVKRVEQLYQARDRGLTALLAATEVPVPQSVVTDEAQVRRQALVEQLDRMGLTLERYLTSAGRTPEEFEADITSATVEAVKVQLLLDAFADARSVTVSNEEYGYEVAHRAQRAGAEPQEYYDRLVKAGAAAGVYGDLRRSKVLGALIDDLTIKDTTGTPVSFDDLREELAGEPTTDGGAGESGAGESSSQQPS